MKANVLHNVGDMRFEEVHDPVLKEGEVLVKVRACGICGSDIPRVFVNGTYHFPTIIGHEFSGEVIDVYSENDNHLIGARASIFPLIPCHECDNCKEGNYEMCSHYNYLGSRCDGGFAEYVAVPKQNLCFIPDGVSFEEAAMLEPSAVAMHAFKRSGLRIGDTVAIFGPGTIGMILAQLTRLAGASKIILVGRSQVKLDFAKKNLGLEYICNSTETDVNKYIDTVTDGRGVDVAFEGTGAGSTMNYCLDVTRAGGLILAMGNPHDNMLLTKASYWKLLRKQLRIQGTWNSSFGLKRNDWDDIFVLLHNKSLNLKDLITHRLPLTELCKGLEIMRTHSEYSNKIMIVN